jgi:hypothetical protein
MVVIDGVDPQFPKADWFKLKKDNLTEADVYGTRYYKRSMVSYELD